MPALPPIVAIAGPTASGKTAVSLALWERLATGEGPWSGAEIVSVDSALVYRGMDIGTAKPDAAARARIAHHLVDILDPVQPYSAARFARDAQAAIAAIRARGRVPLLVGGTLLYFRALFEGLSELPPANAALRAQLESDAARLGWAVLHARLAQVDPVTAARLHPNDAQRIQRALEIHVLTGQPASRWHETRKHPGVAGPLLRIAVGAGDERQLRNRRIEQRFTQMIEAGFVDEVARLRARGDLSPELPSMRAVGYRQIWEHLDGQCSLDEAVRRSVVATRRYAKRQMTWLRAEPQWQWQDGTIPAIVDAVLARFRNGALHSGGEQA